MFYDQTDAEQFIAARTGQSLETVRRFLEKRFRYQELIGITQPDEDPEAERELHSDIISADGTEDQSNVVQYITRTTSLERAAIAAMYAEEVGYMVGLGIMEKGAYPYFQTWADTIAQEEQEKEDAAPAN